MTVRLFLTPTRRALLMAVERGEVHRYLDGHDYVLAWKRCDAAMSLMSRAGWVDLPLRSTELDADGWFHKATWRLTDAGKQVLGDGDR